MTLPRITSQNVGPHIRTQNFWCEGALGPHSPEIMVVVSKNDELGSAAESKALVDIGKFNKAPIALHVIKDFKGGYLPFPYSWILPDQVAGHTVEQPRRLARFFYQID